jgi:hypothetical protein
MSHTVLKLRELKDKVPDCSIGLLCRSIIYVGHGALVAVVCLGQIANHFGTISGLYAPISGLLFLYVPFSPFAVRNDTYQKACK